MVWTATGRGKLSGLLEGDIVSIRGQVMEYTYIPTGIKRELVRSSVDCDWKVSHRDCWRCSHTFTLLIEKDICDCQNIF